MAVENENRTHTDEQQKSMSERSIHSPRPPAALRTAERTSSERQQSMLRFETISTTARGEQGFSVAWPSWCVLYAVGCILTHGEFPSPVGAGVSTFAVPRPGPAAQLIPCGFSSGWCSNCEPPAGACRGKSSLDGDWTYVGAIPSVLQRMGF